MASWLGKPGLKVGEAKGILRERVGDGGKLAARLGRLSKGRSVLCHAGVGLMDDLEKALCDASVPEPGPPLLPVILGRRLSMMLSRPRIT